MFLVDSTNNLLKINDTIGQTVSVKSLYAENYSCENDTGYWTVKVHTPGEHHQMFNFSNEIAYANNFASVAGGTTNGSKYTFIDDNDVDFSIGNLSRNTSISGTGAGANLTINISSDAKNCETRTDRILAINWIFSTLSLLAPFSYRCTC